MFDEASLAGSVPTRVSVSGEDSTAMREWLIVRNASMIEGQPIDPAVPMTFRGVAVVLDQDKTEVS